MFFGHVCQMTVCGGREGHLHTPNQPAKATLQFEAGTLIHNTLAEKHKQITFAGKINENNTSLESVVKGFFDSN